MRRTIKTPTTPGGAAELTGRQLRAALLTFETCDVEKQALGHGLLHGVHGLLARLAGIGGAGAGLVDVGAGLATGSAGGAPTGEGGSARGAVFRHDLV